MLLLGGGAWWSIYLVLLHVGADCWCCLVLLHHTYDVCGVVVSGYYLLLQQFCLMVLLGIVAGVAGVAV